MLRFGFKRKSTSLPRANLVANIPNRYPFVDRDGKHDGPAQLRQFAEVTAGTVTFYHPGITGAEIITSRGGDAPVSVVAGGIVIGVGKAWSIKDSAGHHWSHCAALSPTSAVFWDVSDKREHVVATGLSTAGVSALCSSGRNPLIGTDWLNEHGWGKKKNFLKQNTSLATSPWTKSSGVTISVENTVVLTASTSANVSQNVTIPVAVNDIVRFSVKVKNVINTTQSIKLSIALTVSPYTQVYASRNITIGDEELVVFEWKSTVSGPIQLGVYNHQASVSSFTVVSTCAEIVTGGGGLLSFGDSICASATYEGISSHSITYTSLYGKSKNAVYVNRGTPGDTLSQISAKFDLYCFHAGTILIEGGVNDIYAASSDPNTSMRTLMEALINKALLKSSNVAVLNINWNDAGASKQAWVTSFNTWLLAKCDELGVHHVDGKALCTKPDGAQNLDLFVADKTHLNKAGHEVIANYLISNFSFQGDLYTPPTTTTIISPGVHPANASGSSPFGEPLDYLGAKKNNITRLTGTSTTINPTDTHQFDDTNAWRVVTGWTAGTANFAFDADGAPIPFSGQQAIDAGIGPRLYCGSRGIAGYTVDQEAAANAKIIRTLKVPTYIDTAYWSDSAEMDWSATSE